MVYEGKICDYGVKNVNTPQYFLKSCHRHAQPCQNTRSQERSWEVRTRWERIHLPAWGEGALSPTERVAPRPLTPAGRGLRDTPVWAGGWDALDAQSYPGAGYPALRWYQGCSTGRISTTKPPSPRSSSDGEAHQVWLLPITASNITQQPLPGAPRSPAETPAPSSAAQISPVLQGGGLRSRHLLAEQCLEGSLYSFFFFHDSALHYIL